jgi:hypothetical protein
MRIKTFRIILRVLCEIENRVGTDFAKMSRGAKGTIIKEICG